MKTIKLIFITIFLGFSCLLAAQQSSETLKDLNLVLEKSKFRSALKMKEPGLLERKDSNDNSFVIRLKDIQEVKYEYDGFHIVLILMKKGKEIKGVVSGKESTSSLNAIEFRDKCYCDKAIDLFQKLLE